MRIAYLSTFFPFRGGIAQFNANLYRALEKKNEIKAFTFKRQYPKLFFPGKSQYATTEDKAEFIESIPILDTLNPLTYNKTAKKILGFKPDLLIMKYWMPYFAISLGSIARKLMKKGITNISILDNVIPHERRLGDILLTKYFLNQNSGFIVMSETVKQDLMTLKPNAKYIFHQHPIYDQFKSDISLLKARTHLGISENKKVILFFGYIRDYKGLDIMLEAMTMLNSSYLLVVAGESYGNFKKYEKIIQRLSVQDRIKLFIKYIPDSEVPIFFSAADVCVFPYKAATQSGISRIAYNFEVPLITSKSGDLGKTVQEDMTGLILPELSSEAINSAIRKFFDGKLRESFKENIRKAKSVYTWDNLADAITKFNTKLNAM